MNYQAMLAAVLLTGTAFAQTAPAPVKQKVYRPFIYETPCVLESGLIPHALILRFDG